MIMFYKTLCQIKTAHLYASSRTGLPKKFDFEFDENDDSKLEYVEQPNCILLTKVTFVDRSKNKVAY